MGINKAEKEHLGKVADLGCIVCHHEGRFGVAAEVHHIRQGAGMGRRNSHFETIPLCPMHHRTGGYGVAFHAGAKVWQELYGYERDLLKEVMGMIWTRYCED